MVKIWDRNTCEFLEHNYSDIFDTVLCVDKLPNFLYENDEANDFEIALEELDFDKLKNKEIISLEKTDISPEYTISYGNGYNSFVYSGTVLDKGIFRLKMYSNILHVIIYTDLIQII
jgi:hypothetical protein